MESRYIGLMSGTSLDGIDAVVIACGDCGIRLLDSHYQSYSADFRNELQAVCSHGILSLQTLGWLDAQLGLLMADSVNTLLKKTGLAARAIHAIGSHGHTLHHAPNSQVPFSLQIGDPNRIAEITGITTVADFRRRDIAAGGQGAPLVPAFHHAMFHVPGETRVIVNIGGIANITLLPKQPDEPILGFDTGPGNGLMDYWIEKHFNKTFDVNGLWAQSGKCDPELLARLCSDPFFDSAPPKSTGKEYFSSHWLESNMEQIAHPLLPEDVQATLAHLTAKTIADGIRQIAASADRVLICGGGAHNSHLMALLGKFLDCPAETTAAAGLDPDCIEAMAFAWLAKRTVDGQWGNLPSVTGARAHVILGGIYPGRI